MKIRKNESVEQGVAPYGAQGAPPVNADVRHKHMKSAIPIALSIFLLASGCQSFPLTADSLVKRKSQYENITGSLFIGKIATTNETHESIFMLAEQLAKQNDPANIGVKIVVPPQFQKRYEKELKNMRVTMNLGPRLTMKQFMAEFPFDGWRQCYWSEHEVILIPIGSVK